LSQFDDRVSALVPHITRYVSAQIDNDKCSTKREKLAVALTLHAQRDKLGISRKLRSCGTGKKRQVRALVGAIEQIAQSHRLEVAA